MAHIEDFLLLTWSLISLLEIVTSSAQNRGVGTTRQCRVSTNRGWTDPNNLYRCATTDSCCIENGVPSCCKSMETKAIAIEQLILWGGIIGVLLLIGFFCCCCRSEIHCCDDADDRNCCEILCCRPKKKYEPLEETNKISTNEVEVKPTSSERNPSLLQVASKETPRSNVSALSQSDVHITELV